MRVLIVEDDEEMAQAVGLRRARMAVDVAFDGAVALERLATDGDAYDVLVPDRDLPGTHGDEVCMALAAAGCRTRILMLTAAGTADDIVDGLGLGADDYLPKPFDFPVLVARITALAGPPRPPCGAVRGAARRPSGRHRPAHRRTGGPVPGPRGLSAARDPPAGPVAG